MQESEQARIAVANTGNEEIEQGSGRGGSDGQPFPGQAGNKQNRRGYQQDIHGGSEIRLRNDESDHQQHRRHSRQ